MTTLHDRLADLADEAPPGGPAPELWDRGRRFHRTRRAGTVAIVATASLAIALIVGVSWQRATPPAPAPAGTPAGLPDQLWTPSKWLPGTDDAGPLGQLAAVVAGDHASWTGTSYGLFGVSATTGEYRFLDLPDYESFGYALSPDGRQVAYWTGGTTTGSPSDSGPIAGFTVYDAVTGDTERREIATEHGLAVNSLAWADNDRLVLGYGQYQGGVDDPPEDQSFSTDYGLWSWTVGSDDPVPIDSSGRWLSSVAGDGKILVAGNTASVLLDLDEPGAEIRIHVPDAEHVYSSLVVDPTGTRVAGIWGGPDPERQEVPNKVKAGTAPPGGGVADLSLVPDSKRTFEIIQWTSAGEIVVVRTSRSGEVTVERQDPVSGAHVTVVTYDYGDGQERSFAGDLLTAPTFEAEPPPDPFDPRLVIGTVLAIVLVGVGLLVLWRRRVRP